MQLFSFSMINEFDKGVMNKLWRIPAFKEAFNDPNIKKMTHCRCWPLGRAQYFFAQLHFCLTVVLWIPTFIRVQKCSGHKHWANSKVVNLISDPNLYKCMIDPAVMSMLNPEERGLGTAQFSVFHFLKHSQLETYKRTGKVSFVQCQKWFLCIHAAWLMLLLCRSVVNINKWSDNGHLFCFF